MSELSPGHVRSSKVMTVGGPIPADQLGITLMHEHILNDCRCWWHEPTAPERRHLADRPVSIEILGELRMDPFVNRQNCTLDDEALAVVELAKAAALGCRSVVDPTCRGIGRNPRALLRISQATGLQIVMGAGYYLETSHPPELKSLGIDDIADQIVEEAIIGIDGTGIRIGLIGEIGVSGDFTAAEQKSLCAAARAQMRTRLPLMIHLPAWFRHAHRVLDTVEEEGGELRHTVLCHMNPSGHDVAYQTSVADRGAFLEYDMIGMDYWYADQQVQCPSDEENARAIAGLVERGYGDRILLSQDVFLKMMLTRYGGFGYGYLFRHFLPRLKRRGLDDGALRRLIVDNPRRVFQAD